MDVDIAERLVGEEGAAALAMAARQADPAGFDARRLAFVERVARALRPDVLLPAGAPYGEAADLVGRLPVDAWRGYLTAAAARASLSSSAASESGSKVRSVSPVVGLVVAMAMVVPSVDRAGHVPGWSPVKRALRPAAHATGRAAGA